MTEPAGELWLINEPFHQTDVILRPLIFFKTIDIGMTQGKLIATKAKQSEIVLTWFEKSFLIWSKKFIDSNGCFFEVSIFLFTLLWLNIFMWIQQPQSGSIDSRRKQPRPDKKLQILSISFAFPIIVFFCSF